MNEVWSIFGKMVLDDDEYNKELDKTEKKTEKSSKKMGESFKKLGKGIGIATGAIVGAGAAALAGANKFAETTDRIDKLSQKVGLSREGFQEWEFILSQSGADVEVLQGGMKTLTQRLEQAAEGAGLGAESFAKLGLAQSDVANLNQEEAFELVVEKLQQMEDGAEKAALANELLGRAGSELMPLLNGAAGSVDVMKEAARDLGLVIGGDAIDAGVQFTDQMDQIKRSMGAAGTQIIGEMMPAFIGMADWILAHMPQIQSVMSTVFNAIGFVVGTVIDMFNTYALPILTEVFDFIQQNWPTIQAIGEEVFGALFEVGNSLWDLFSNNILPIFKTLWEFIEPTFPLIGQVISTAFDVVIESAKAIIDIFGAVLDAITSAIEAIKDFFDTSDDIDLPGIESGGGLSGSLSSITGRANGGRVTAGRAYRVNERTPNSEIFVPSSNGSIMAGSGQNITVQINNPKVFDTRDANKLGEVLVKTLRGKGINPNG